MRAGNAKELPLPQDDRRRRLGGLLPGLCVLVATLVPFLGALGADFVNWDDDLNLLQNDLIRGFDGPQLAAMFTTSHMGHWHPLTWLSLAADHALFGLEPRGYHAHSLLLHGLAAVAFGALLRELLRHWHGSAADEPRFGWLAAVCALLFSVHPLRVESVVWVTERRDVLSGLFWIVTVWLWLRSFRADASHPRRDLVLAHAAFVLSLLSKAWGITLPVVLLLLDVWPLRRRERGASWRRLLAEKAGFIALAAGAAALAAIAQGQWGARVSLADHPLVARCFQACYGLCLYAGKTLVPVDLAPLYPLEHTLDWTEFKFAGSAVAVSAAAALLLWRRNAGALVGAAVFAVVGAPVLGFLQSGPQIAADRYTYLACLPFPAAVLYWLARGRRTGRAAACAAVVALALGALTVRQTAVWRDSTSLWEHTLSLQPDSFNAHYHYGRALRALGQRERALVEFRRTVALQPREWKAWYVIGNEEYRAGRFAESYAAHRQCQDLAPADRDNLYGLAIASAQLQRFDECVTWCRRVQQVDAQWPHSWPVCADALRKLGRAAEARAAFEEALRLDPKNQWVREQLAGMR